MRDEVPEAVLVITHSRGGGTERAVEDAIREFSEQGINAFIARPDPANAELLRITRAFEPLGTTVEAFNIDFNQKAFAEFATAIELTQVEVHHWIDFADNFLLSLKEILKSTNIPYSVRLHDYYSICPRVHLADETNKYCGLPSLDICQSCVKRMGSPKGPELSIRDWIKDSSEFLSSAVEVTCPSSDALARLRRRLPEINLGLRPNWTRNTIQPLRATRTQPENEHHTVLVIGEISAIKGSEILASTTECALEVQSRLKFVIIGNTDRDNFFESMQNVFVRGRYAEQDLPDLIEKADPTIIWFPGLIPETFSFALSDVLEQSDAPIVSFQIGAIPSRVLAAGRGTVLPMSIAFDALTIVRRLERISDEWESLSPKGSN